MIDPSNVDKSTVMDEAAFRKIGSEGNNGPLINVVEIPNGGWAIFGPYGVFEASDKKRSFDDLALVHKLLKDWGVRRFVQGGEMKKF